MLRIIQSTNSAHAKSYYSTADYYLGNEQELAGQWRGEGARRLGLEGEVKQSEWDALCDNQHPQTGERITSRQRGDRTIGYDFNFHVPKSVSLLYAETRDDRILDAFRESVHATMQAIEAEAQARVRKDGRNENRETGNLVWGEFVHFTSRPVDGVPDPHLHSHCYVFNVTHDDQEQKWKAGQFRDLKRDAPYFEAMFHSRFGQKLTELGLPIERTVKGWELAGVQKGLVRKFSRRTQQIEEKAREMGVESIDAKAQLGAKTREHKQKDLSFAELQEEWRSRMSADEQEVLKKLERCIGSHPASGDTGAAAKGLEYAIAHSFERKSVVPERALLATALKQSIGRATVEQVRQRFEKSDLIRGTRKGQRMVTTRGVLAEEKRLVDFARKGRGTCKPLVRSVERFTRDKLDDDQKSAIRHILQSRDRVIMLRGKAGTGKTTLMQETVEAIEKTGTKVFAFAPSAEASRGVLRNDGFKDADTVAMLLKDTRKQRAAAGQVIWIDEAGLLGSKTITDVFTLADKLQSRVLLSGDRYQHGSVERGAALRLLEEEAGIKPADVRQIHRQKGRYREAVKLLAEGKIGDGFKSLDDLGWIREIAGLERYKQIAADYVRAVLDKKTSLVISPTHAEGNRITGEIRQQLRQAGKLKGRERSVQVLRNLHLTEAERGDAVNLFPSYVLVFHQNAKGYTRGQRLPVADSPSLPLDHAGKYQVYQSGSMTLAAGDMVRITQNGFSADGKHRLDNGSTYRIKSFDPTGDIIFDNGWRISKDFGHLDYGYVTTSHSSQGKTVQRVFVGQGYESLPASSREQLYVSASRAKEQVIFYTGNKQEMLEAVSRSDERITATEFVGRGASREDAHASELQNERIIDLHQDKEREHEGHER